MDRIFQYSMAAVPALIVVAVAAVLLRWATREPLRRSWLAVAALSVGCIAIPPVATFIVLVNAVGVYDVTAIGAAALVSSLAAGLLLALLLRGQAGAGVAGALLWPAVIAAELSFMVKLNSGGWIALGELIWGVYFAAPVIHVLVRVVTGAGARGWALVVASLVSDAVIVATTLLRVDASDTPSYVVYDHLVTHRFFVPPWLVQIVAVPGTGGYDFLLYVPVAAMWALCLGFAWREARRAA